MFFFFKHKTAYEMRISDWSSDVCSSDLSPIIDSIAIFKMQRRSPTAAAAAPDIAVVRFAAVYLLGDVLGKTCRLDTGPIAIERRIVTRAGINVVADMSAIGFHHLYREIVVWGKVVSVGLSLGGGS